MDIKMKLNKREMDHTFFSQFDKNRIKKFMYNFFLLILYFFIIFNKHIVTIKCEYQFLQ